VTKHDVHYRLKVTIPAQVAAFGCTLNAKRSSLRRSGRNLDRHSATNEESVCASAIINLHACPLGVSRQNFQMERTRKCVA
jgi:hypothetical protein